MADERPTDRRPADRRDVCVSSGRMSPVTERSPRLRRDPWTWIGLIWAIAFVILAIEVNEREAIGFDDPVSAFVKGLPVPTDLWLAITAAGGVILVPIGVAVVVTLLLLGRARTAIVYGVALAGASLWTHVVKVSIGRLRPPEGALVPAPGFSFPSGHALNSMVTYGLIALLIWRTDLPAWVRLVSAIGLATLVALIGLSRIALGVHYPSDVVGGWLAGLAIVAIVAVATREPDSERRA